MTDVYWLSDVPDRDPWGSPIGDHFYDAPTRYHGWAILSEESWKNHGSYHPQLGTGKGQRYDRQPDGRWKKTGG